jgi:hypothetical protein
MATFDVRFKTPGSGFDIPFVIKTTQTLTGKASITTAAGTTSSSTLTGQSRVTVTAVQTLAGRSRATAATVKTLTGKSRSTATTAKTLLGRTRSKITAVQTLVGKSRASIQTTNTLTGKSRLTGVSSQTLTGKALIVGDHGSIRFTNPGDELKRTSALPTNAGLFSCCFWAYISGASASNAQTFLLLSQDVTYYVFLGALFNQTLYLEVNDGGQNTGQATAVLTQGVWAHVAVTRSGTSLIVYLNGNVSFSVTAGNDGSYWTPANLESGHCSIFGSPPGSAFTDDLNGRIADFKYWDGAVLTQAEIQAEMASPTAVRSANLYMDTPLSAATVADSLLDQSGLDHHWSSGGTLVTELGPPFPNAQILTGKSRVTVSTSQTLAGKSRIVNGVTKTLLGRALVQLTQTKTLLGRARALLYRTQTLPAKSRVKTTSSKTLLGRVRSTVSTAKTLLGKAKVTAPVPKTLLGRARAKASVSLTLLGKSKITAPATPKTILGRARATITTSRTLAGKSRVVLATSKTLFGKSRITGIVQQTLTGRANINTLQGGIQTLTGKARILIAGVTKTLTGKSRVLLVGTRTLLGRARVVLSQTATITGKARVFLQKTAILPAKSRVKVAAAQTRVGKSRISVSAVRSLTGRAFVIYRGTWTLLGRARIVLGRSFTLPGRSRITTTAAPQLAGRSRVLRTASKQLFGRARAFLRRQASLAGRSRITVGRTLTLAGRAKVLLTYEVEIKGRSRITVSTPCTLTGVSWITGTLEQILRGRGRVRDIDRTSSATLTGLSRVITEQVAVSIVPLFGGPLSTEMVVVESLCVELNLTSDLDLSMALQQGDALEDNRGIGGLEIELSAQSSLQIRFSGMEGDTMYLGTMATVQMRVTDTVGGEPFDPDGSILCEVFRVTQYGTLEQNPAISGAAEKETLEGETRPGAYVFRFDTSKLAMEPAPDRILVRATIPYQASQVIDQRLFQLKSLDDLT